MLTSSTGMRERASSMNRASMPSYRPQAKISWPQPVYLAALAMEESGSSEGPTIRDAMRSVSRTGTSFTAAQFKDAVAAIKSDQDIDYDGASGPVDFDSAGDVTAPYDIWQVKNGAVTIIENAITP